MESWKNLTLRLLKTDDNKEIVSDEIEIDDIGLRLGLNKSTRSKYNISESVKGVVITAVKEILPLKRD